jgi:hypothetical protein
MAFTDDDLKRLKEQAEKPVGAFFIDRQELKALIARLEAAEKLREALKEIKQKYNSHLISSAYVMKAIAQAALSEGSEKE